MRPKALAIIVPIVTCIAVNYATSVLAQMSNPATTIGVLPNVSARVVIATYQPMRAYLSRELKTGVEIATATDFRSFHERTLRGEYDLVVTAANLGRVAQVDAKWTPIAIYDPAIPALLVTAADNKDTSIEQLRGKALALANPQSLVALRGYQWLQEQGLQSGRDFSVTRAPNDDSLGSLIRSGEAPMAIMSMGEFRQIGESTRKALKIEREFARVPAFWVLANPRLSMEDRHKLKSLLLGFAGTEDGQAFIKLSGFRGIRDLPPAEQETLDSFVGATRAGLASAR
jgi:phosphonate transport system substrate-binding protein